ncbi:MAG: hypothetical protein IPO12_07825 [Flavobacteriales bacterium]|nr:hypothetical protein [Flavobacteriales bacterium]
MRFFRARTYHVAIVLEYFTEGVVPATERVEIEMGLIQHDDGTLSLWIRRRPALVSEGAIGNLLRGTDQAEHRAGDQGE